MQEHTQRWTLIPFWGQEGLSELHDLENRLFTRGKLWHAGLSMIFDRMAARYKTNPFWHRATKNQPGLSSDEQAARLWEFRNRIYPIWKGMQERWYKKDETDPTPEIQLVHAIDDKVFGSGISVDRNIGTREDDYIKQEAQQKFRKISS